jgi:Leucine-rich repeat (LRR) protein
LRCLDVSSNHLTSAAAISLVRSGSLAALRELDLGETSFDGAGIRDLMRNPGMKRLTVLRLHLNEEVAREGMLAMASSPYLAGLRSLTLSRWFLPDSSPVGFDWPHLGQLTHLDLQRCSIGPDSARALAKAPALARLRSLNLSSNALGDEGAQALACSGVLTALVRLDLAFNRISARGLAELAESTALTELRELVLDHNLQIGDEGIIALSLSPMIGRLISLQMRYLNPGPDGVNALIASPYLGRLLHLDLTGNPLNAALRKRLRQHFGGRVLLDNLI